MPKSVNVMSKNIRIQKSNQSFENIESNVINNFSQPGSKVPLNMTVHVFRLRMTMC